MTTIPDITALPGQSVATLTGPRALEAVDLIGAQRYASGHGWLIPLDDLPALRTAAITRGWTLEELPRFVGYPNAGATVPRRPPDAA